MRAEFLKQVDMSGDCWNWQGPDNPNVQRDSFRMFRKHEYDPSKAVEAECGGQCVRPSHLVQSMNEQEEK